MSQSVYLDIKPLGVNLKAFLQPFASICCIYAEVC